MVHEGCYAFLTAAFIKWSHACFILSVARTETHQPGRSTVTPTTLLHRLTRWERLNFLLTNRIPRRWATLFMGRFSRIRHPWIKKPCMGLWQFFAGDLRLEEAEKTEFDSMHDCFVRALRPGMRPLDPDPARLVSPCDGIIGAMGETNGTQVFQAKGYPYDLAELLGDDTLAERYRNGSFLTLRITASMYHRFHAPDACQLHQIRYISGDTWNVNPVALKRVEKLFCRNERAILELHLPPAKTGDEPASILLVPVAAILVASIRLYALEYPLNLRYEGANHIPCSTQYERGEEMGYFEQGSTIIVLTGPELTLHPALQEGQTIHMGEPVLNR
ncbi:phosphatidylserine decarboxylase [Halovibrio salipaludis]|uniref:phosphatidylserine decarboxylase n=1 Tax=Halovibrio salipaludis TaxID=2032626 RepID=A0A2A2F548_9GAMM|nr:phosphatidylserine decarboxylase [Halovibrio salipaludis]